MLGIALRQLKKINQLCKKLFFKKHKINQEQQSIIEKIEKEGVCVVSLDDMNKLKINTSWITHANELKKILDNNEKEIINLNNKKKGSYVVGAKNIPEYILKDIFSFALSDNLIKIIENYLGMKLLFRGIDLRKDLNDNQNIETRIWHIDGEDSKILKILFYLEEVDFYGGPFSYIKKNIINKKSKLKKEFDGRVSENEILKKVEMKEINKYCGNLNQGIFVDTANIYHKGTMPIKKSRYAIFFCYNSESPLMPDYCKKLVNFDLNIIDKNLQTRVTK
jgi:hypothetical protein